MNINALCTFEGAWECLRQGPRADWCWRVAWRCRLLASVAFEIGQKEGRSLRNARRHMARRSLASLATCWPTSRTSPTV